MRGAIRHALLIVGSLLVLPCAVFAQASITGVAKDPSGAVLPGVTVEAASPALIEKVRTAVTDGTGQYRIESLRPGTYTVTFTLAGFSAVRREGVELAGSFTATVNADLRVGALQETVTVRGETPIVDVQNTTQQRVMNHELIDSLPTGRSDRNMAMLLPAVSMPTSATQTSLSQDVGGTANQQNTSMAVHGSRPGDQRIMQNGVNTSPVIGTGSNSVIAPNMSAYQEVTIDTAGISAERSQGGVVVNFIPKDGGNVFSGTSFFGFANESMQSNNFTQALQSAGLRSPDALRKVWDVNPGLGGPIKQDKLWFYLAYKNIGNDAYAGGILANKNANDPNVWTYDPDPNSAPYNHITNWDLQGRITWQISPRNKLGLTDEESKACFCSGDINATTSPEAALHRPTTKQRNMMFDWTTPVTSRLLFEASGLHRDEDLARRVPVGTNPAMIAVTEQSLGNLRYRTVSPFGANPPLRETWYTTLYTRWVVSYITGSHAVKVGYTTGKGTAVNWRLYGTNPYEYRFNKGVPNQITLYAYPFRDEFHIDADNGLFAQDRWTIRRLTASYGVRYDHFADSFPAQTLGPAPLVPNRNLSFPASDGVSWHDVSPRFGLAYDVFGDGHTAVKVSLNKYMQAMGTGDVYFGSNLNPLTRVAFNTTRSWSDANHDYIPQCDLLAPGENGECGPLANANFGTPRSASKYNPDTLSGWNIRSYNWEFSTGVQHELLPRVSVDVAYFRRWYGNFFVVDNRAVRPSDFTQFSIPVPNTDSRLPTAGQTLGGFYDLNPNKVGESDPYVTFASDYGKQTEHWNGIDVGISARLRNGVTVQGGTSTGRTTMSSCEVAAKLPAFTSQSANVNLTDSTRTNAQNPFCDSATPWLTQVKFLATYTIPKIDAQVSGTLQSITGPPVQANFIAPNALVAPSLGRNLSGGAQNVSLSLIDPQSMTAERVNQVDMRFGKILRYAKSRTAVNVDVFNLFNSSAVLGVLSTFGGARAWQAPQAILQGRLLKVSAQFDF